jgi:hypothetical protein
MDLLSTLAQRRAAAPAVPLDLATLVGTQAWSRLPPAVRRRFTQGHADTTYEGSLDLSCSLLGRCFAAASLLLGGPLTGIDRASVPASVRTYADGAGGVVWERHLGRHSGARVVRSTKLADRGSLIERTDGGLAMELEVFEEEGALVFRSRRYFLALGGWRIAIPALLSPGVCRVEHRDLGQGHFRFSLSMVHPLWGRTFQQTGVFTDPQEDQE